MKIIFIYNKEVKVFFFFFPYFTITRHYYTYHLRFWLKSIKVTDSLQARKMKTLIENYLGEDLRVNMMTEKKEGVTHANKRK